VSERIDAQTEAISVPSGGNERTADGRDVSSLGVPVGGRPRLDAPVERGLVDEGQSIGAVLQCRHASVEARLGIGDGGGGAHQRLHHHRLVVVERVHQMIGQLASRSLHSVTACTFTLHAKLTILLRSYLDSEVTSQ